MAENVDLKSKSENAEDVLLSAHCQMCLAAGAKYTCPRCNISYCSVPCYQSEKHAGCSEAFYKDCVLDELKDLSASSEDKKKVLEMLMKDMQDRTDEEGPEEDHSDDLAERLEGLDLDRDVSSVWNRLTPKEKEQFARMIQDGRLARLIEMWTPWWLRKENLTLVHEESGEKLCKDGAAIPEILFDVPDINGLLKNIRPSSNCRFDVVNTLHAYAFVSRLHNGSHLECPVDATQDLLDTCCVLQKGFQCGSVGEAVQTAQDDLKKKQQSSEMVSPKFPLTVLKDVKHILQGPGKEDTLTFIWATLSNVLCLIRSALAILKKELKSEIKEGNPDLTELKSMKSTVFKAEKKLVFLLSWSQRYGVSLHQLLPLLQFEIETRESDMDDVEEIKSAVEAHMDKLKPEGDGDDSTVDKTSCASLRKLIEEVN